MVLGQPEHSKPEAKDFLEQVKKADVIIKNKLIERQQWHDLALTITANMDGERVQSSGTKSKLAEAVEICVDAEDEILTEVSNLRNVKKMVTQVIQRLYSYVEYNVLHMRYIQYMDLQEIADHYGKEYGWATTTHGRALKNVQKILDGKEKEDD
jgi:hypothetical protein